MPLPTAFAITRKSSVIGRGGGWGRFDHIKKMAHQAISSVMSNKLPEQTVISFA